MLLASCFCRSVYLIADGCSLKYDDYSASGSCRLTCLVGLFSHTVGYVSIWLVATGRLDAPYWLLIAFGLLASSGLLWLDTAAIVTNMRNFPMERGDVAGSPTGYEQHPCQTKHLMARNHRCMRPTEWVF